MKLSFSLFVLLVGLALSGCHRSGVYSATAEIEIKAREQVHLGTIIKEEPSDEFEVITAPDVLSPVITDLNLDHIWAKRLNRGDVLSMNDALEYLRIRLKLENKAGTGIVRITVVGDTPLETAHIANAIADRYKTMRDTQEKQREDEGFKVLRQQIAQQAKVVESDKDETAQNPKDENLRQKSAEDQSLLEALNLKLTQDLEYEKLEESPVYIVTRAVPPPE